MPLYHVFCYYYLDDLQPFIDALSSTDAVPIQQAK
jgi:hypothetical protein